MPEEKKVAPVGGNMSPPPTGGGGGIVGNIKQHWPVYTVVLAIITILVIIMQNKSSAQNTGYVASGYGSGNSSPSDLYGSQLDADYQQMMSYQNTTNGLLQKIVDGTAGTSGLPTTNPQGILNTSTFNATVRSYGQLGQQTTNLWDRVIKAIPLRSAPNATPTDIVSYVPFDTQLQVQSTPIFGGGNLNSQVWFKTTNGQYISSVDIANAQ